MRWLLIAFVAVVAVVLVAWHLGVIEPFEAAPFDDDEEADEFRDGGRTSGSRRPGGRGRRPGGRYRHYDSGRRRYWGPRYGSAVALGGSGWWGGAPWWGWAPWWPSCYENVFGETVCYDVPNYPWYY
jgi:hypothetical protein